MGKSSDFGYKLNHLPKNMQRLVIAVLSLVLLTLVIMTVKVSFFDKSSETITGNSDSAPSPVSSQAKAKVVLYASEGSTINEWTKGKGIFKAEKDKPFVIGVYLTGEGTDAAQVSMNIDPNIFTYVSQKEGGLLPNTIVNTFNNAEVKYIGSTDPNKPFLHMNDYLLYVTLTPKVSTTGANITLDLSKNKIAQKGKNVLDAVESLTVVVE